MPEKKFIHDKKFRLSNNQNQIPFEKTAKKVLSNSERKKIPEIEDENLIEFNEILKKEGFPEILQ